MGHETEHLPPPSPPSLSSETIAVRGLALQPQAGGDDAADSDTDHQRARPQLTLIHPPPVTQSSHKPVSQERQRAVAALVDYGVWRTRAEQLVDRLGLSPEVVERACAMLDQERQRGSDIANPGAVLAARLEAGLEPPPRSRRPTPMQNGTSTRANRRDLVCLLIAARRLDPERPSVYVLAGLGRTGRLEAVPVILAAVPKEESKTEEALYHLSHRYWDVPLLGEDITRVEELAQALQSDDTRLVITAIWVLGSLMYPCQQLRDAYLKDHDTLEGLDVPAIYGQIRDLLVPMLSHPDPYVRWAAVNAMNYAGDETLVPVLSRILIEDTHYVAREALDVLARLRLHGIDTSAATPALITAMGHSESLIARRATIELGSAANAPAIDVLMELTEHPDGEIRSLAAFSLSGHQEEKVFLRLLELFQQDPVMKVRKSAAHTLYYFHDPRAIVPLVQAVNAVGSMPGDTYELRRWAAMNLGRFDDERAVTALQVVIEQAPEWQMKMAAVKSLGAIGDPQSRARRLYPLLDHDDSLVRTVAANQLGYVGTGTDDEELRFDIVERLIPRLEDLGKGHLLRPTVASAAAKSLHFIGTTAAQEALDEWNESKP